MCWWAVAGQVALQAMGIANQNSAQASMAESLASGSYKQMNYAFENYEIERQDAYDAAVDEILKTRINSQQLGSQVNAAIMQDYQGGGRTAARLMRDAEAETARAVSSIQENYNNKSSEIDLNKERTLLSTNDYLANLKEQYKPNKLGDILSLGATALQGYNAYRTQRTAAEAVGGRWSFNGSTAGAANQLGGSDLWNYIPKPSYSYNSIDSLKIKTGGYL